MTYRCLVLAATLLVSCASALEMESMNSLAAVKMSKDDLSTPEWLQNIPQESKVAKYRKRRFASFPTGSTLEIEFTLTIPVEGVADSASLKVVNTLTYNLPNDTIVLGRTGVGHSKVDVYTNIESALSSIGYDGHACTLRSICEIAEMPFEHGLMGEVVNMIFSSAIGTADPELSGNALMDEYATAEYYGRHHGSCWSLYPGCPISITNLFTRSVSSS
ncbi:uncharacterized protein LOC143036697 [Oratosquilla oratoria]|uniref:uncharacterized protein LOC143036697 n=1 Tax=Oratosquilla oratoria TaxID=337810 RepID=UPI003F761169